MTDDKSLMQPVNDSPDACDGAEQTGVKRTRDWGRIGKRVAIGAGVVAAGVLSYAAYSWAKSGAEEDEDPLDNWLFPDPTEGTKSMALNVESDWPVDDGLFPEPITCTECGEEFEHEDDWDFENLMCVGCSESSDWPSYCCGLMYEDGETVCFSCGEPL